MKKFPDNFLWGASTSSMQVEGGIAGSDWSAADKRNEVPHIGKACDHYNRYEEDFDIAKKLNHNAHRFSIEWARIEPKEGEFDEKELAHYKKVIAALKERGLEPFVTVWHFSLPLWFSKSGSFARGDAPEIFARYAAKLSETFGEDVTFYMTMNEPLVWLGEHGKTVHSSPGLWPNPFNYFYFWRQLTKAHRVAYTDMKKVAPHAEIGIAKHQFSAVGTNWVGKRVASLFRYFWNRRFLNDITGYMDFIGIQFYQRLFFWQSQEEDAAEQKTDIGWQMHPEAIYDTLVEVKRYKLPLYVTEAGLADEKDQWRAHYIHKTLIGTHRAIEEGADVRGFFYWSLLDNYEFTHGYATRFGLVQVDHEGDQTRTVRESAKKYAAIVAQNGPEEG